MKRFLITYRREKASEEEWHKTVGEFISAIDSDPDLKGRLSYRCMKAKDASSYYHLAEVRDEETTKLLQQREFFQKYTAETKRIAGGAVEVTPLEVIAETRPA